MSPPLICLSAFVFAFAGTPLPVEEVTAQTTDLPATAPGKLAGDGGLVGEELLRAARTQVRRSADQQAADLFRQAIEHNPGNMAAHVGLAAALLRADLVAEATRACSVGLAQDSTSLPLYNTLSASYATQGRFGLAILALEQALAVEPDYVLGLVNLGGMYIKLGHYAQAEEALAQGRALAPQQPEVRRRLGELYLETGRPGEAAVELAVALQILPGSGVLHYLSGKALEEASQFECALEAYLEACHRDPGFSDAHYRLATLARRLERKATADSAMRAFQRLHAIGRSDPDLLVQMEKLRAAILDSPEEPVRHFRLAGFFARHGYDREALNRFARVFQLDPRHFPALNRMGAILLRGKKPRRALIFFEQTLLMAPDFVPARLNAGNANMVLGRPGDAVEHYAHASILKPQAALIWYQLARASLALSDHQTAAEAVNKGLLANITDEKTRRSLEALAAKMQ